MKLNSSASAVLMLDTALESRAIRYIQEKILSIGLKVANYSADDGNLPLYYKIKHYVINHLGHQIKTIPYEDSQHLIVPFIDLTSIPLINKIYEDSGFKFSILDCPTKSKLYSKLGIFYLKTDEYKFQEFLKRVEEEWDNSFSCYLRELTQVERGYSAEYAWGVPIGIPSVNSGNLFLEEGLLESIDKDIVTFLANKEVYKELGIPYKRSYMLVGPPGTGKTSLIKLLASKYGLPIFMGRAQYFDYFINSVASIKRPAIIVLEDLNWNLKVKDESTGRIQDLLQFLDGLNPYSGQIFIITTNFPEEISPSLTRPGRVDKIFELKHITPDNARRMAIKYQLEDNAHNIKEFASHNQVTPAQLQQLLLDLRQNLARENWVDYIR